MWWSEPKHKEMAHETVKLILQGLSGFLGHFAPLTA